MKTSTKVFLVLFALTSIPAVVLFPSLASSIAINSSGLVLNFSLNGYIALALFLLALIFGIILYFRFLKTLSINKVLFFSTLPFTLIYGFSLFSIACLSSLTTPTANAVKSLLNITENGYNSILWAVLLTILYIVLLFIVYFFVTKPVYRIEKLLKRLGDGKIKQRKLKIGGGKQFSQISHALVKINNNYHNIVTNENFERVKLPKLLQTKLSEEELLKLQNGQMINIEGFIVLAKLEGDGEKPKNNFDMLKLRLNELIPLSKRFDGLVFNNVTDTLAVLFFKSENALDYAHALCRAIKVKSKHLKCKIKTNICVDSILEQCYLDQEGNLIGNDENLCFAKRLIELSKLLSARLIFSNNILDNLPSNYFLKYRYIGNLTEQKSLNLFESLEVYVKSKRDALEKGKSAFEKAVCFFEEGQKKRAEVMFENILRECRDDKASFVYFNKCRNG